MSKGELQGSEVKISRVATIIIFLALIRCIAEVFRLQYYSEQDLLFSDFKPFLLGALVTSSALLLMTILSYFGKHKLIIACLCVDNNYSSFDKNFLQCLTGKMWPMKSSGFYILSQSGQNMIIYCIEILFKITYKVT